MLPTILTQKQGGAYKVSLSVWSYDKQAFCFAAVWRGNFIYKHSNETQTALFNYIFQCMNAKSEYQINHLKYKSLKGHSYLGSS